MREEEPPVMVFVTLALASLVSAKIPENNRSNPRSCRHKYPNSFGGIKPFKQKHTPGSRGNPPPTIQPFNLPTMAVMLFARHRPSFPLHILSVAPLRLSLAPFRSCRFSVALAALGGQRSPTPRNRYAPLSLQLRCGAAMLRFLRGMQAGGLHTRLDFWLHASTLTLLINAAKNQSSLPDLKQKDPPAADK